MNEDHLTNGVLDLIKSAVQAIAGVGFLAVCFCCLFAPALSPVVQDSLMKDSDGNFRPLTDLPDVYRQMVMVKLILWIVCLSSWAFVIISYIRYQF